MVKGVEQAAVNDLAVTPIDRASRGASSLSDFLHGEGGEREGGSTII
jgi:hypothetical protein